jgi:hypothetical protein
MAAGFTGARLEAAIAIAFIILGALESVWLDYHCARRL